MCHVLLLAVGRRRLCGPSRDEPSPQGVIRPNQTASTGKAQIRNDGPNQSNASPCPSPAPSNAAAAGPLLARGPRAQRRRGSCGRRMRSSFRHSPPPSNPTAHRLHLAHFTKPAARHTQLGGGGNGAPLGFARPTLAALHPTAPAAALARILVEDVAILLDALRERAPQRRRRARPSCARLYRAAGRLERRQEEGLPRQDARFARRPRQAREAREGPDAPEPAREPARAATPSAQAEERECAERE